MAIPYAIPQMPWAIHFIAYVNVCTKWPQAASRSLGVNDNFVSSSMAPMSQELQGGKFEAGNIYF